MGGDVSGAARTQESQAPGKIAPYAGLIALLAVFYAFAMLDRQILAMLGTPVKRELGIGDFELGLLLGPAFALSYTVFGAPFGYLSDKWSRPKTICLGLMIWTLGTASCGLAGSFAALFAFRTLVGAAESALSPSAHALIAENVPKQRMSMAIFCYTAGSTIGYGLSMTVGGSLLDAFTAMGPVTLPMIGAISPWQMVFLITAAPGLILAPLALTLPASRRRAPDAVAQVAPPPKEEFWRFVKKHRGFLLCLFAAFSLTNTVVYATLVWGPQHIERTLHFTPGQVGMTFGIMNLICPLIGGPLSSFVVDRAFKGGMLDAQMRLYAWAITVMTPFVVLAYFATWQPLFWLGMGVVLALMTPIFPIAAAGLQNATPAPYRGVLAGALVSVVNVVGAILGPAVIGALVQFVFKDPSKLGWVLGGLSGVLMMCAVPILALGAKFMRAAVAEQMQPNLTAGVTQ